MSDPTTERLYHLLPSIYRIQDAERGEPLRALLAVIETEFQALQHDMATLYDNWFIETCEEWVVPYIGDLLGAGLLHEIRGTALHSLRAYVANLLAYRRRKGTLACLEQLAHDLTGWAAHAVEFYRLLSTTQQVNHLRPENVCTVDIRRQTPLELLHGPFDRAAHSADLRRISQDCGWYDIPNIGLFLWRLQAYPVERGTARRVGSPALGRFTFDPLGRGVQLFNRPQTEAEMAHLAEEINVPGRLRRRVLHDELEARRQAWADGRRPQSLYLGDQPVLKVFLNGAEEPLSPDKIAVCDLSSWKRPPVSKTYFPTADPRCLQEPDCGLEMEIAVAVDPELGRLSFPEGQTPQRVEVSYAYGFSSDVGGGPYDRRESVARWLDPVYRPVTWQLGVTQDEQTWTGAADPTQLRPTLQKAVEAWNAHVAENPTAFGLIAVMDNSSYVEELTGAHVIEIPAGSRLALVAADWPAVQVPGSLPGHRQRIVGQLVPEQKRPHLYGEISVRGVSVPGLDPGEFVIDGLLVEGDITVLVGNLGHLRVQHCSLIPEERGIQVHVSSVNPRLRNDRLSIRMERSICDTILLPQAVPELQIVESIVGRTGGVAISAPDSAVQIESCTIQGRSEVHTLEASNSIFTDWVQVERRQVGCVRFCYLPEDSPTPRRFYCQPARALADRAREKGLVSADELSPHEVQLLLARVRPEFTSERYGDPGYAQLSLTCAEEIRSGAEDGSEMGVFQHLQQPQREANLRAALDEMMRFGLEAGLIYTT